MSPRPEPVLASDVAQGLTQDRLPASAPMLPPGRRVLIVSACNARFMPFLRGMFDSIATVLEQDEVTLGCFDIGLGEADRVWLRQRGAQVVTPGTHLGVDAAAHEPALRSFLARPFLREYFPGHDVYLWIDSDVWLQDPQVIGRYVRGALDHGMAVTHERERGYRFQSWLLLWTGKHFALGYGPMTGARLLARRHLNAGFFAIAAGAPHWEAWAQRYRAAIERTGSLVPHDQFALNQAIYHGSAAGGVLDRTCFLEPGCNWICDRGVPMWNDALEAFCKPYAPFEPIGALHLAGPAKRSRYVIERTGGGSFETLIVRGACPARPVLDLPWQATPDRVAPMPEPVAA